MGGARQLVINVTSRSPCMERCATTLNIASCATTLLDTDAALRPTATVASDKAAPPQGINFNLLVHRIHTGDNLLANRPYIVVGFEAATTTSAASAIRR